MITDTSDYASAQLHAPDADHDRRPGHQLARLAHWLAAEPRAVLSFTPVRPREDGPTPGAPRTLPVALAVWRRRIARRRTVALARRWLLGAVILACACALANRLLDMPFWWTIAGPLALACCAALALALRPLPLAAVARLLDRELLLREQVASALEITEGRARGTNGALSERLQARALAALIDARRAWAVRLAPAKGEWLSILALAAVMALLALAPRPASAPTPGAAPSRSTAVSSPYVPTQVALAVPTLPAQGRGSVPVSVAVVSTPAPRATTAATGGGRRPSQTPQVVSRHPRAVARPQAGTGASRPTGKGVAPSGQSGKGLPGAPNAPRGQQGSGAQGSSISVYKGNNRRPLPSAPPGAPTGRSQGAAPGGSAASGSGAASKSGAAGRSAGATARGAQSTTGGPSGAPPAGAQYLPYGGGFHLTPSQLPKPGLITGKGSFQGHGTPGGGGVGRQQGSSAGQGAAHVPKPGGQGRQLTLKSGYGSGKPGTQTGKPAPGRSSGASGQATAGSGGAPGGLQVIDYVPADANVVAPGDRSIVSSYFVARAAQQ